MNKIWYRPAGTSGPWKLLPMYAGVETAPADTIDLLRRICGLEAVAAPTRPDQHQK